MRVKRTHIGTEIVRRDTRRCIVFLYDVAKWGTSTSNDCDPQLIVYGMAEKDNLFSIYGRGMEAPVMSATWS